MLENKTKEECSHHFAIQQQASKLFITVRALRQSASERRQLPSKRPKEWCCSSHSQQGMVEMVCVRGFARVCGVS